MHKKEILKIRKLVDEKGKTLVPLRLYFKNGKAKLEFGLGQGKKMWDKRQDIKNKEVISVTKESKEDIQENKKKEEIVNELFLVLKLTFAKKSRCHLN